jgi:hypothetical protein
VILAQNPRVWRWLAVLTAEHVLPLYKEPDYPETLIQQREQQRQEYPDHIRYEHPAEALNLARHVLRGEYDHKHASQLASDLHYVADPYLNLPSIFVQRAANRALGVVSDQNVSSSIEGNDEFSVLRNWAESGSAITDRDWVTSGQGDTASCAAIAWSCIVDPDVAHRDSSGKIGPIQWNWWLEHERVDPDKLLAFWLWWLETALPRAWTLAEEEHTRG